ncbi:uncharacterized protein N7515_006348 [Penicillium bovifimosum]|uniref:BRCT domain-containing protein n=1 Tax=Penicillium bovifimosum TaxID=126998 RepID=A0A9W9L0P0_9EURO|nr:uncharacterized protein N7515_006348 [Penicillium bovifimosum]KAJ5130309.1 hypothetical protein N7515_006348 [Penicillium bovifimosum]
MARAAVIPQSPAKRAGRPSTKSTAATEAKKKAPRKVTPAPRTATPALDTDADSDDELGFITTKPTKPSGRPPGVQLPSQKGQHNDSKEQLAQQEPPKKRVGRPRKNPLPTEATASKPEVAPKPRGRPRAGTTAKAPATRETAASSRRTRAAADTTETKPNTIKIATNSTTMRSNLLRGPAKKKTVKFQDVAGSDAEDTEPEVPPAGRRRVAANGAGAGKTGLAATPVRKAATTTRGRKPAAKKAAPQPLSPKKAKQVAKTLSAYASSDSEDDELNTIKDDTKQSVKLLVHSPVKHGLGTAGLSSPVRKINFTPKKATSFVDENGEPKLPTPKHGSEGVGLNSPVRKINFTPNRSQTTIADHGHLALPPGNSVVFSDSMFMSSPARRPPQSSPFRFSIKETPNRGVSLFQDSVNPISAPDFTPGRPSPLKMSPKKGLLGASFSQSPFKASTAAAPARTPLFQSPAKRIASPFKSSMFSARASVSEPKPTDNDRTPTESVELDETTSPIASPRESHFDETDFQRDTEMVEDVARDIFGIELSFNGKSSSSPPERGDDVATEAAQCSEDELNADDLCAEVEAETEAEGDSGPEEYENEQLQTGDEELETICFDVMEDANMAQAPYEQAPQEYSEVDEDSEETEELEEHDQPEYDEIDTVCFDTMEGANMPQQDPYGRDLQEYSEADGDPEDTEEHDHLEYEEADTICFDAMEDAHTAAKTFCDEQLQEASESETDKYIQDEADYEYEELETICFDAMEDAHVAGDDSHEATAQTTDSVMEDMNDPEEELAELEKEIENEELYDLTTGSRLQESTPEPTMAEMGTQTQMEELVSPPVSPFKFAYKEETQSPAASNYSLENEGEGEGQDDAMKDPQEEDQVMSDNIEVEDTEPTPIKSELSTIHSQFAPPLENIHVEDIASPLQGEQAIPSPLLSPAVGESTPLFLNRPANIENDTGSTLDAKNAKNDNIDMPLHEANSPTPSTQFNSPALMAPSLSNTPSLVDQHQSPAKRSLGFTPLAQKFSRWEQDTPSQARSLRPRRRGVFSLVGPLDRTNTETPKDSGGVSYPDLSRSPLLNTPSLFAELPLQPQSDVAGMSPEHEQTSRRSSIYEGNQIIELPCRSTDIFEDPDSGSNDLEHALASQAPQERNNELDAIEDKENHGPAIAPSTPMKVHRDELRTIHTVSKVPLKAEGDVSPLKLSRKRGLSLSSTSPTRSSPRVRKPAFMTLKDNAPVLTPSRKVPRASKSPTPKRRSITARRSSGKAPVMASPSAASPAKKPRRSLPAEQKALHGAVVHVDVHTTEGEDASGIFVELLQQMGARCVKSWSWNPRSSLSPSDGPELKDFRVGITHVVYKDGGLRTLEKVKKAAGLVKCVGVGWVLDCERENQWLDETPYAVDSSIVPRGGAKRRKSMEPRALSNVNGTLVRVSESPAPSAGRRRSGVNPGAVEGFRKITPPTHKQPATPPQQISADSYKFPATPGYNFANLDAIGMSPATPAFLGNRSKLVQQSCPPKQTNRGLFPSSRPTGRLSDEGDDEESRRQRRFRMEAARRKSLVYKPAVGSPLAP